MTTKDYVYLGLLGLASLIFYCHGFYAGVNRSARIYDELLKDGEADDSPVMASGEEEIDLSPTPSRHSFPSFPRRDLHGDFGNN